MKRPIPLLLVAACVVGVVAPANAQTTNADKQQILALVQGLAAHSVTPSQSLDPNLSEQDKAASLKRLQGPYELTLDPRGDVEFKAPNHAQVPVHFDLHSGGGETEASSTADVVKVNGAWYFANFNFLATPTWVWVMLVGINLIGVIYGIGVLRAVWKRFKAHGRDLRFVDIVTAFFPWTWGRAA